VNWNALDDEPRPLASVAPFDGRNWEQAAEGLAQSPKA
jgi:hypothetical protein